MEAADELESPLRPKEKTPEFTAGKVNMAPRNEQPFLDDPLRMAQTAMGVMTGAAPLVMRAGQAAYSTITNPPPVVKDAAERMFDTGPMRTVAAKLRGAATQPGGKPQELGIGSRLGDRALLDPIKQQQEMAPQIGLSNAIGNSARFAMKNHLRDKWIQLHGADGAKPTAGGGYALTDILY